MKHFDVVSIFPEMFKAITKFGITRRALEMGLYDLSTWNPRDFSDSPSRAVDGRPYGGGPGMVMSAEPLTRAIEAAVNRQEKLGVRKYKKIYLTPQGRRLDQNMVKHLSQQEGIIFLSGRYEGVDERVIESSIDCEISIGDYVLSGGELPAMVIIDTLVRRIPGAIQQGKSIENESFENGLLDHPQYTRPEIFGPYTIPEVLVSGNHKEINRWRKKQSLGKTWLEKPELIDKISLDVEELDLLEEFKKEIGVKYPGGV
tara:strand:- start:5 stop:778 length:774 start_codon:yes stop_codon:yes gene_type:complete